MAIFSLLAVLALPSLSLVTALPQGATSSAAPSTAKASGTTLLGAPLMASTTQSMSASTQTTANAASPSTPGSSNCSIPDVYSIIATSGFYGGAMPLNGSCQAGPIASCYIANTSMEVSYMIMSGSNLNTTAIIYATNYTVPVAFGASKAETYAMQAANMSTGALMNLTCPATAAAGCSLIQTTRYLNVTGAKKSGCDGTQEPFEVHFPILKGYTTGSLVQAAYSPCIRNGTANGVPSCESAATSGNMTMTMVMSGMTTTMNMPMTSSMSMAMTTPTPQATKSVMKRGLPIAELQYLDI